MYDFFGKRKIFFALSLVLTLLGIAFVFINGINLDISFRGGAVIKYTYEGQLDLDGVTNTVSETLNRNVGIQTTNDIVSGEQKVVLSLAGNESLTSQQQASLDQALKEKFPSNNLKLSASNMVEPFIGKRFLRRGITAIILAFLTIVLYVWIRFKRIGGLSAGLSGVVALVHDCLMVFFTFVIFKLPIDEIFIAVVLTIIGYSINDTIVIFDRVRENSNLGKYKTPEDLINVSVNQTLSRTINTALVTTVSVLVLLAFSYVFSIESIQLFALPMTIGMIFGCYSTIFIAGPLWAGWQKRAKANKTKPARA